MFQPKENAANLAALAKMFSEGKIKPRVSKTYPLVSYSQILVFFGFWVEGFPFLLASYSLIYVFGFWVGGVPSLLVSYRYCHNIHI